MLNNVLFALVSRVFIISFVLGTHIDDELYEGSLCPLENGDQGICKKLPDCPSRLEEVRKGRRNSNSSGRCGFVNFDEIVCCSINITDKIEPRPSEAACQQFDNKITINNVKTDGLVLHIFGGTEAQSGEFPYMVALGYENDDSDDEQPIRYNCGGTLISSEHVLTAAHCVKNINNKIPIEVRLGSEDIKNNTEGVQRIPISDIISHPQYKLSMNYNDVAILKLRTKIQSTSRVKPICLQTKPIEISMRSKPNTSVVVIGWGLTSFDDEGSAKLMRTPGLSLIDRDVCAKSYSSSLKLPNGLDENMICALDTNSSRRADACQGDSGGPLLMLSDTGDSIIGITAFGQSCGGPVPGVFMSVYPYLDWIEDQVWPNGENTNVEKIEPLGM